MMADKPPSNLAQKSAKIFSPLAFSSVEGRKSVECGTWQNLRLAASGGGGGNQPITKALLHRGLLNFG